jgi:membrane protease YdiL (CAAX protease family)
MLASFAIDRWKLPWNLSESLWGAAPLGALIILGDLTKLIDQSKARPSLSLQLWSTIVGLLMTFAILLVPVYVVAIRRHHATREDLGFRPFDPGRAAVLIAWILVLDFAQLYVWAYVRLHLHWHTRSTPLYFGDGLGGFLLALGLGSALVPVVEETFFRGFLFPGLRTRLPFWIAASASGLLFGLGHDTIMPRVAVGVLLAWVRERTGSVWPCIIAHALINTTGFSIGFLRTGRV